jgi:hypothetical protein
MACRIRAKMWGITRRSDSLFPKGYILEIETYPGTDCIYSNRAAQLSTSSSEHRSYHQEEPLQQRSVVDNE